MSRQNRPTVSGVPNLPYFVGVAAILTGVFVFLSIFLFTFYYDPARPGLFNTIEGRIVVSVVLLMGGRAILRSTAAGASR